ncbi:hypothetical protein CPB86DRAFT_783549 [Serendipita vermifera]|nr:hypothetical protein CPB86DRAFT_783549 [Serendipita vermifera]
MESNCTSDTIQNSNDIQERAFYRIPVEIWCRFFHHAVTLSLFPYTDDGSLSLSILHNPYLYGAYQKDLFLWMPYFDRATYANQQRRITRLRQVCRLWNDIIKRYIAPKYQWMFINSGELIYPPSPRPPHLVIIDYDRGPNSTVFKLVPNRHRLFGSAPSPSFTLPDHDFSQVKIAVFGLKPPRRLQGFATQFPSLRSLTLDMRGPGFMVLLRAPNLMEQLTHLSLIYYADPRFISSFKDRIVCFPNVQYFSIHFDHSYFPDPSHTPLFPKWQLRRLVCLSIAGHVPLAAGETLGSFFGSLSMGSRVTDVLLDFSWPKADPRTNAFWQKMWTEWFPHLNLLGISLESLDTVTSSLLSARSVEAAGSTTPRQALRLFLLLNNIFGQPQPPLQWRYEFAALGEMYRAGHLERIYLPESQIETMFADNIVYQCQRQKIPVYDVEGWQIRVGSEMLGHSYTPM